MLVTRRTSALAGIVLGPLWLTTVALLTWAEWSYLHSVGWSVADSGGVGYPSATARGPYGAVQVVNFALAGVLMAVFLVSFRREFRRRLAGRVATVGLGTFALAGLFNACPTDLPGEPHTWHGTVHLVGFVLTMLGMLVGYSAAGLALRGNPDWRGWRWLGWTPALLLLIAFTNLGLTGERGWFVFLVVGFGWSCPMGLRLLQLDRVASPAPAGVPLTDAASPGLL